MGKRAPLLLVRAQSHEQDRLEKQIIPTEQSQLCSSYCRSHCGKLEEEMPDFSRFLRGETIELIWKQGEEFLRGRRGGN